MLCGPVAAGWALVSLFLLAPFPVSGQSGEPLADQYSGLNLHNHTYCSDGVDTPEGLVQKAREAGIRELGITDHDTVECLDRARKEAEKVGIRLIPGIEVSAEDDSIHLLGIGIDPAHPAIRDLTELGREARVDRAKKISQKLQANGCPLTYREILESVISSRRKIDGVPFSPKELKPKSDEEVLAQLGSFPVTRPHIADLMVEKGCVRAKSAAAANRKVFDDFLGDNGCCSEPLKGPTFDFVIRKIHEAGGIASLAHPHTLFKFAKWPKSYAREGGKVTYRSFYPKREKGQVQDPQGSELSLDLLRAGLDGFEMYKQGFSPTDNLPVLDAVWAYGKESSRFVIFTVGSDYHGGVPGRGARKLEAISIPALTAEALHQALGSPGGTAGGGQGLERRFDPQPLKEKVASLSEIPDPFAPRP